MTTGTQAARPNLVLVGFMGTGKSAVGRRAARKLDLDFVDMDDLIENRVGKPISELFREEGEVGFRARERALVEELAGEAGRVIATGGGVVLDPRNLLDFERGGVVVCLLAGVETILRRVAAQDHRPLLEQGDKRARVGALLEQRRPLYQAIRHRVDTDHNVLERTVAAVVAIYRHQAGGDTPQL